jgi:hypothetical protein
VRGLLETLLSVRRHLLWTACIWIAGMCLPSGCGRECAVNVLSAYQEKIPARNAIHAHAQDFSAGDKLLLAILKAFIPLPLNKQDNRFSCVLTNSAWFNVEHYHNTHSTGALTTRYSQLLDVFSLCSSVTPWCGILFSTNSSPLVHPPVYIPPAPHQSWHPPSPQGLSRKMRTVYVSLCMSAYVSW